MNIWIRILITFWKCLWRESTKITDPIEDTYQIGPTEADLKLMNNARYLLFTEVARLEIMLRTGIFKVARKEKWLPLVASQTIRYKRPLKRFQRFKLKSKVVGWDEKWFFIEHVFSRNQKIVAFAMVKGCFRGSHGVITPEQVFSQLDPSILKSKPTLPKHFTDWNDSETLQERSLQS